MILDVPLNVLRYVIDCVKYYVHMFMSDLVDMFVDAVHDIPDMRPLPKHFNYSFCLISYFWTVVYMTSKTLGHRLARISFVNSALDQLMYLGVAIAITYVMIPVYLILADKKLSKVEFPVVKRRIALIVSAFVFGLLSEHIWIHWLHSPNAESSYYFPFVIGLCFQLVGPFFADNRLLLLMGTVGLATFLSLMIAAKTGTLCTSYTLGALICCAQSTTNMQILIGEFRRRQPDEFTMTSGHLKALLISVYTHVLLTALNARYDPVLINECDVE